MSEKCRIKHNNNNNSDKPLTSRRTDREVKTAESHF